jgi:hypothetical protein
MLNVFLNGIRIRGRVRQLIGIRRWIISGSDRGGLFLSFFLICFDVGCSILLLSPVMS